MTEHDFDQSLALSQYAFQYVIPEDDKERRKEMMRQQEIWGEFEGDELISKTNLLDHQVFIGEKTFSMGGVAGVATWPEHRRKGSVGRLLKHSLSMMKERSQVISYLHPFDFHFYRRFGWELAFSNKKYSFEKKDLIQLPHSSGKVVRVNHKEKLDELNRVYETYFTRYSGMLKRSEYWWNNHVCTKGIVTAVYYDQTGEPAGYILYKVSDRLLDVEEIVTINHEALRGLWNFICQHDSMVDKVKMVVPQDDQLPFLLHNPRVQQEIVAYFMARIVDVEAFLKQYPFKREQNESILLYVTDEVATWNNGTYTISKDSVQFEPMTEEGVKVTSSQGVFTDIQTLTALLLGYQTATFLYQSGKLTGDEQEVTKLDRMITAKPTCFYDFF